MIAISSALIQIWIVVHLVNLDRFSYYLFIVFFRFFLIIKLFSV